jgi:dTDP-4-dehydrorhamnose reductase
MPPRGVYDVLQEDKYSSDALPEDSAVVVDNMFYSDKDDLGEKLHNIEVVEKNFPKANTSNRYSYLVLGSSGYLGSNCVKYLKECGRTVIESTSRLENYNDIKHEIIQNNAKYVICAAGISGRPTIDWCDSHEEETRKTNYTDVVALMETCKDIHLTIFGSGTVYSGNKKGYSEYDDTDFTSKIYCKYRVLLEKALLPNVLYLRIMYPCTFDGDQRCFVTKMRSRSVVHDVTVSITSVPDLFPKLPELIEGGSTGIFNFVCDGGVKLVDLIGSSKEPEKSSDARGGYILYPSRLENVTRVPLIADVLTLRNK